MVNQTVAKLAVMAGMVGMGMARSGNDGVQIDSNLTESINVNQKQQVENQVESSRLINQESQKEQKVNQMIDSRAEALKELKKESEQLAQLIANSPSDEDLVKAVEKQNEEQIEAFMKNAEEQASKYKEDLEKEHPEKIKELEDEVEEFATKFEEVLKKAEEESNNKLAEEYKKAYLNEQDVRVLVKDATASKYTDEQVAQLTTDEILKIAEQVEDYQQAEQIKKDLLNNEEARKQYEAIIGNVQEASAEQILNARKEIIEKAIIKATADSIREHAKAIEEKVSQINYECGDNECIVKSEEAYDQMHLENAMAESCKALAEEDEELRKRIEGMTENKQISDECAEYASEQLEKELEQMEQMTKKLFNNLFDEEEENIEEAKIKDITEQQSEM